MINLVKLVFFCSVTSIAWSETTKEPTKDDQQQSTFKMSSSDHVPTHDSWESNPHLKTLWVYRPASLQPHHTDDHGIRNVMLKPPHLVTRLAKPLTYGFDPYFNKGYFEPFERRRKPVTLVAFRKRGLLPRQHIQPSQSLEVAELQSPYNEISSFWHEEPELFNL